MKGGIFISYSRKDVDAVSRIREELELNGFPSWMDLHGVKSGEREFTDAIAAAIDASKVFLFFLSDNSLKSEWAMNELRAARNGGKCVIFIGLNDVTITTKFTLDFGEPDIIYWDDEAQKEKLIRDLDDILGVNVRLLLANAQKLYAAHKYSEAAYLYRRCADIGDADAQYWLGWIYYSTGNGVEGDDEEAVRLWQLAANQSHARAQCYLGMMYDAGRGVAQDKQAAFRWYLAAARQGDAEAQCCVGEMYNDGENGLLKDCSVATKWFLAAANRGHVRAQRNLGLMYQHGRGVKKDLSEALRWYARAAERGDRESSDRLARIKKSGQYRIRVILGWVRKMLSCLVVVLDIIGIIMILAVLATLFKAG